MDQQSFTSMAGNRNFQSALIAVFILLALFLATKTVAEVKSYRYIGGGVPSSNTITVSGSGEVFAVPDTATFSFSVTEERPTVEGAQAIASERINSIIAFLKDNSIKEEDIKTVNYNVYPRYEYNQESCITFPCPRGERELVGFEVNQTVSVKVRDTQQAGSMLSGIGERGAANISGLSFAIEDEDALKREARQDAIDEAKTKAKELAKDLDVRLVRIVNFSEGGDFGIMKAMTFDVREEGIGGAAAPVPEIPVGENKIVSNVSITYEIR